MTNSDELREQMRKEFDSLVYEVIRYNKFNLSDEEALNTIKEATDKLTQRIALEARIADFQQLHFDLSLTDQHTAYMIVGDVLKRLKSQLQELNNE